jgi:hypothetical protein
MTVERLLQGVPCVWADQRAAFALLVESFDERANATRLHDNDGDIIARSARRAHAMRL